MLAFIEEVVGEPAYVAGNSLGGYIGTNLAANHPRSVLGLALLNATPFWAFRQPAPRSGDDSGGSPLDPLPSSSPETPESATAAGSVGGEKEASGGRGSGDWLGWDGILPAPTGLFRFGAWYFDRMRDPRTVKNMLGTVYSNSGKYRNYYSPTYNP